MNQTCFFFVAPLTHSGLVGSALVYISRYFFSTFVFVCCPSLEWLKTNVLIRACPVLQLCIYKYVRRKWANLHHTFFNTFRTTLHKIVQQVNNSFTLSLENANSWTQWKKKKNSVHMLQLLLALTEEARQCAFYIHTWLRKETKVLNRMDIYSGTHWS